MNEKEFPKTLLEAIKFFAIPENALAFMVQIRWPDGIACPHCDSTEHSFISTRQLWKCKGCKKQFRAKVGTIFEDSPISLDKWFPALWMIVNMKNGISSYELAKHLGITQKSAWFMNHRIRRAMQCGTFKKLAGEVEVDETFIGGKARNMHPGKRAKQIKGTGGAGKVAVMGLLERHGEVRTMVVSNVRRNSLHGEVSKHVEAGSTVYSDAFASYRRLEDEYIHNVINHAETYVRGNIHTNGIENFWALLKRTIGGTYVSVEPFHLFRYLDEQSFRFNTRKGNDASRFLLVAMAIVGKRLTFDQLTGKTPKGYETSH